MSIKLTKNDPIILRKSLSQFQVGLGWDDIKTVKLQQRKEKLATESKKKKWWRKIGESICELTDVADFSYERDIDLDASVLVIENGACKDMICFHNLRSVRYPGAVKHHGDNLTGVGDGDDEVITIDTEKFGNKTIELYIIITSYSLHTFNSVGNFFVRVLADGKEELRYDILDSDRSSQFNDATGMVVAKIANTSGQWEVTAICEPVNYRAKIPRNIRDSEFWQKTGKKERNKLC